MPADSAITALGQEMIDDLPPVFRADPTLRAILHVQAKEAERRREYINQVRNEVIPQLAGDTGLAIYEYILGLNVQAGQTLEERRTSVMGFLQGVVTTGEEWVAALDRILPVGWSFEEYAPDRLAPQNLIPNPNANAASGDALKGWTSSFTGPGSAHIVFQSGAAAVNNGDGWYSFIDTVTVGGVWRVITPANDAWSWAAVERDRWYSLQVRILIDSLNLSFTGRIELWAESRDPFTGLTTASKIYETSRTLDDFATAAPGEDVWDLKGYFKTPNALDYIQLSLSVRVQPDSGPDPGGANAMFAPGRIMIAQVEGPDKPHPTYADPVIDEDWYWTGTAGISPSKRDIPTLAHHIRVFLPFPISDPRSAVAEALIRGITNAADHLDFVYAPGFVLDASHLDTGTLS